jgi:hypothetical protein
MELDMIQVPLFSAWADKVSEPAHNGMTIYFSRSASLTSGSYLWVMALESGDHDAPGGTRRPCRQAADYRIFEPAFSAVHQWLREQLKPL